MPKPEHLERAWTFLWDTGGTDDFPRGSPYHLALATLVSEVEQETWEKAAQLVENRPQSWSRPTLINAAAALRQAGKE